MSSKLTDQQTNLLLVREIRKRPILYNYHHPGYTKMHETEKAWKEIGKVVKLTWSDCKQRWKNIRTVFIRHMKIPKTGSGAEKKAYYLADSLQFCIPYIKVLGRISENLSQLQPNEEMLDIKNSEDDDDDPLSDIPLQSPSSVSPPNCSSSISTPTSALLQFQDHQYESIMQHIPKRECIAENNDVFMEYSNRINETSSAEHEQEAADSRKEALKMFFLSMLPDLMKMDDQQLRQFKRKTLDVVDDILFIRHG